jgi:hypothetical protein
MCEEKNRESEKELEERFDRFIKSEIFKASNEYRKEKGWPLLTEEEADELAADEENTNKG